MDGNGTTLPLYVGQYKLTDDEWGSAWTNDGFNIIYVNKGFKITLWQHLYTGTQAILENKDSDIPKRFNLSNYSLGDSVSSVKAEWIEY